MRASSEFAVEVPEEGSNDPQDLFRLRMAHTARVAELLAECQVERAAGRANLARALLVEAEQLLLTIKELEKNHLGDNCEQETPCSN